MSRFFSFGMVLFGTAVSCAQSAPVASPAATALAPRVLIVGGGPSVQYNQVAIESNVRYVQRLLPPRAETITLFADGDAHHASVLADRDLHPSRGQQLLDLLLESRYSGQDAQTLRKPQIKRIDGASDAANIQRSFKTLSQPATSTRPILLYFTGHGGDGGQNYNNNIYSLWDDGEFSTRDLAAQLKRLPPRAPVVLVMVQCYSGGFANVLFKSDSPRDIAGFFATVKERMAAGCTSEVNEAEYHDFTSYFFRALSGRDRVGRTYTRPDPNHDGRTGMDEAFYDALARDESIDVPICTSDEFVRRFVPLPDATIFATPYATILNQASPAQRVALEELSRKLKLEGEDRPQVAMQKLRDFPTQTPDDPAEMVQAAKEPARARLLKLFPGLKIESEARIPTEEKAAAFLDKHAEESPWREVFKARRAYDDYNRRDEARQVEESRLMRFVRACKTVVLSQRLLSSGAPNVKARFQRLRTSEARSLPLR